MAAGFWTEQRKATVRRMVAQGATGAEIARQVNGTRNQVAGFIWREGLSATQRRVQTERKQAHRQAQREQQKQPTADDVRLPRAVSVAPLGRHAAVSVPVRDGDSKNRAGETQRVQAAVRRKRQRLEAGQELAVQQAKDFTEAFAEGYQGQQARYRSLLELPRSGACRFPIDLAGGGTGFCGGATDSVYCAAHAARCIAPAQPRRNGLFRLQRRGVAS